MSEIDELLKNGNYDDALRCAKMMLSENSEDYHAWYYCFLAENNNYMNFDGENPADAMSLNKALELAPSKEKKEMEEEFKLYVKLSEYPGMSSFIRNTHLGLTDSAEKIGKDIFSRKCTISGLKVMTEGVEGLISKAETREQLLCYHEYFAYLLKMTNDLSCHKGLVAIENSPLYYEAAEDVTGAATSTENASASPKPKKKKAKWGGLFLLPFYLVVAFLSIFINYALVLLIYIFAWIKGIFHGEGASKFGELIGIAFAGIIMAVVCIIYEFYMIIYCVVSVIKRSMSAWEGFKIIVGTVFNMFYGTSR